MPPTVKTENKYGLDWVLLNNRWYCVQNYSPTKLADDTDIPIVTDASTWAGLTTPARCVYNNSTDAEFIAKYGYLYNWYAVDDSLKMPCSGCHVPSSAEWDDLIDWMVANGFNWDGTTEENKIGKAVSSNGGEWDASETEGHVGNDQSNNNSSEFTALPAGIRNQLGTFTRLGSWAHFWATESQVYYEHQFQDVAGFTKRTGRNNKVGCSIRISRPRAKIFFPPQLIYQGL